MNQEYEYAIRMIALWPTLAVLVLIGGALLALALHRVESDEPEEEPTDER